MTLTDEILIAQFEDDREEAFELMGVLLEVLRGKKSFVALKALSVMTVAKLVSSSQEEDFEEIAESYLRMLDADIQFVKNGL